MNVRYLDQWREAVEFLWGRELGLMLESPGCLMLVLPLQKRPIRGKLFPSGQKNGVYLCVDTIVSSIKS